MITHTDIGYNGRLGNQLYIYALLLALKKRGYATAVPNTNCTTVKLDGCYDTYHKYWIPYRCVLYDYFDLSLPRIDVAQEKPLIAEQHAGFDDTVFSKIDKLNVSDNINLRGYFQSYKYFNDIRTDVIKEFSFKPTIQKSVQDKYNEPLDNTVCIHIRLGDTLGQPRVYKLSADYISDAFELLKDVDIDKILVFSDNIEYCKPWFPSDSNVTFIENLNEAETLHLMTQCKHFIMSPSTFSWWAAYLGEKPDSKVIFPINWFGDGRNLKDLLLTNWQTL